MSSATRPHILFQPILYRDLSDINITLNKKVKVEYSNMKEVNKLMQDNWNKTAKVSGTVKG